MIESIIKKQRDYFNSSETLSYLFRINSLKLLKEQLYKYQFKLQEAFIKDYNKQEFDFIATEFSMVIMELNYMIKHLKKFMKIKKVKSNLINFPSKGYIYKEPYGVTLIMSPWNYPLQLSITPLIGAIACGNTVVLKPSQYSYNVSLVIKEMLEVFDEKYIYVCLGGREVNQSLLDQRFDYIFFTGGEVVGKLVMEKASKYLTPITLELGGKSPCIVDKDADLKLASKRIVWGKYLNAGQTCVAPDFLMVHKDVKDELIKYLIDEIKIQNYVNGKLRDDFCFIINEKHVNRLKGLIENKDIIFGGTIKDRLFEPTILDNISFDDLIMKEEIFGPILPIITFNNIEEVVDILKTKEKPLALYYFSNNKKSIKYVMNNLHFGGGCINDTIMHLTNHKLPFGGVGRSGMGSYHGIKSFETFSHQKSILKKGKIELKTKFAPYKSKNLKFLKRITKVK